MFLVRRRPGRGRPGHRRHVSRFGRHRRRSCILRSPAPPVRCPFRRRQGSGHHPMCRCRDMNRTGRAHIGLLLARQSIQTLGFSNSLQPFSRFAFTIITSAEKIGRVLMESEGKGRVKHGLRVTLSRMPNLLEHSFQNQLLEYYRCLIDESDQLINSG